MKIKSVLVLINPAKDQSALVASQLKEILDRARVKQNWMETLPSHKRSIAPSKSLQSADLALVCGGDGTMLQGAHILKGSGIPLLGINTGYLGFITTLEKRALASSLRRVLAGEYQISERLALDVEVSIGKRVAYGWALNDVLISRGANPQLISISSSVGGKTLTPYRCDGLLVATPTGSTAYALAAGGPIISPECGVVTITPICPQALTNRSVVVGRDRLIKMCLCGNSGHGEVQADGTTLSRIGPHHQIRVQASATNVPLAFLSEVDFFDTLAHKLQWHGQGMPTPKYFRK
jgi:NAD+ kinase